MWRAVRVCLRSPTDPLAKVWQPVHPQPRSLESASSPTDPVLCLPGRPVRKQPVARPHPALPLAGLQPLLRTARPAVGGAPEGRLPSRHDRRAQAGGPHCHPSPTRTPDPTPSPAPGDPDLYPHPCLGAKPEVAPTIAFATATHLLTPDSIAPPTIAIAAVLVASTTAAIAIAAPAGWVPGTLLSIPLVPALLI